MISIEIVQRRLHNQYIAEPALQKPSEVVGWLGAVQAQEYPGALWAVGLRMREATEGTIEQALAERTIVRTWPMRGTLHFVTAEDVRWMLELMTPRILASHAGRLKQQFDLDEATFGPSRDVFVRALQGGRQLTRDGMYRALEAEGIAAGGGRGLQILWRVAQEGLICFGTREGKQHRFALLDEWVPNAKRLAREEALAELARRYFTSHGPATVQDLVWWSGLTTGDARAGLEMVKSRLAHEVVDGRDYWFSQEVRVADEGDPRAYLLPSYDEYTVGYRDRTVLLDPADANDGRSGSDVLNPVIVVNGRVKATWKRVVKKDRVAITVYPFGMLTDAEEAALVRAASHYGRFLGMPITLS